MEIEQAVVRWVKDNQVGVSFLQLPPEIRTRLERVFQLLNTAQQPRAKKIHIPAVFGPGGE